MAAVLVKVKSETFAGFFVVRDATSALVVEAMLKSKGFQVEGTTTPPEKLGELIVRLLDDASKGEYDWIVIAPEVVSAMRGMLLQPPRK
jgi:hypothetical protein